MGSRGATFLGRAWEGGRGNQGFKVTPLPSHASTPHSFSTNAGSLSKDAGPVD